MQPIKKELSRFKQLEREIKIITLVIFLLLIGVVYRAAQLIYEKKPNDLWTLLAYASPLCAALLAARNASRTIANDDLNRLNEQRLDIAHATHHLIAVIRDLQSRIYSVRKTLAEGGRPLFILPELAKTIESRYEVLLERETYKFLPGDCIDLISNMAGGIFGLVRFVDGVVRALPNVDMLPNLEQIQVSGQGSVTESIDKLLAEIELLLNKIFDIRQSLER